VVQTQPHIHRAAGANSLWGQRPGRKADHSLPSGVEVQNEYSCTSTSPLCLNGVHRVHLIHPFGVVFPSPSSSRKGNRKFVGSYVASRRTPTFISKGYWFGNDGV
jgi:hypothetical protein